MQENMSSCLEKLMYSFFTFMVFYQNIDASLHTQMKNHHHHEN
jgi:hypothetical protein